MTHSEIVDKANTVLRDEFELTGELLPESRLREDLDIDSLDVVDVVVLVHDTFGFKLTQEELKGMKTLQNLYDCIEKHVK